MIRYYVYKMYLFVNKVSQKVLPFRVYPWHREVKKSVKTEEKCTEKPTTELVKQRQVRDYVKNVNKNNHKYPNV
jgi:hypothetical protein